MSGFLVAEKNRSETNNTASHPTLERTIVRMKPNLSVFFFHTGSQGSTNSKTDHKTGKRHRKITSYNNRFRSAPFFNQD